MKLKALYSRLMGHFGWVRSEPAAAPAGPKVMKINQTLLGMIGGGADVPKYPVTKYTPPPGVVPHDAMTDQTYLATDSACNSAMSYAGQYYEGEGFPGYPYLAQLQQRSEYRSPSETLAMEMTRKWLKLVSHGDGDNSDKLEKLEAALKRFEVRQTFRRAIEHDGFFGMSHIHVSIKGQDGDEERKLPLIIDKATVKRGSLLGFQTIEPLWTAPYDYNSLDPTDRWFYRPRMWFVLGKQTHATRLLTIVSRPVPDMLKPAYNFGGIAMSQLMEPYVNSWLRTRAAVSDLIHAFSTTILKTTMSGTLAGGEGGLLDRMKLFIKGRDNRGLMVVDKNEEDVAQLNVPLGGLDALQAQSQEQMAAPCHMPLVKLTGVTPSGLNASAEPEMDAWYDYVAAQQQNVGDPVIKPILDLIQLNEFGEIDPAIGYEWVPMKQLNGKELAEVRTADATSAVALIGAGVISPLEERKRLAADPASGYNSIDVNDAPEPMVDPDVKPDDGVENED